MGFFEKLKSGLTKTRENIARSFDNVFTPNEIDDYSGANVADIWTEVQSKRSDYETDIGTTIQSKRSDYVAP